MDLNRERLTVALRGFAARLGIEVARFPTNQTRAGLLRRLLTEHEVDWVVDVGANRGQFGQLLRSIGFGGLIVSIEPVPEAHARLVEVAARRPPWETIEAAVGSVAGRRPFHVAAATEVSSFHRPAAAYRELFPGAETTATRDVEVHTLDALLGERVEAGRPRVLLKTDTQGADLDVLAGAGRVLDATVALHCEVAVRAIYEGAPVWREAVDRIEELGFALSGLYPVDTDPGLRLVELDALFVRQA